MSRPINVNDTLTFNPTGTTESTNISTNTNYPLSNGYNSISNTSNYARLQLNTNSTSTDCYIYYTFTVSGIPTNATITNVDCVARIYRNSRVTANTAAIQLYNGTTAKGSETNSFGTSASNVSISNTGSWSISELNNIRLRIKGRRSNTNNNSYIYFYGATLSVTYSLQGTEYEITSTLNTYDVDSIDPAGSTWVTEGENYELIVYTDSTDDIIVEDNGIDVTDQLVLTHPTGDSSTDTFIPISYDSENSTYDSEHEGTPTSGLTAHTDSNRICAYVTQTAYAEAKLIYNFDCSSIPRNAIISSVTCIANAACYSSGQYFDTKTLQLYSGSTAKGSAVTITGNGNTSTSHNINGGSWTRAELDNAKIVLYIKRGNNTTQASFSFWGATLSVTYSLPTDDYYVYTISNVSTDHTITIDDTYVGPKYLVTATSNYSEATITPEEKNVPEGRSITFTINVQNLYEIIITDNGNDIKNSLVGSNGTYTYTLTNVQTTHTIAISEQLSYSITASSTYSGATVSVPSKVYIGQNATVTVIVDDFSAIKIFDDDTDITSSFTGSGTTYTYTLTNVQANHNISIIEKGKINVTCVSNVEGVTLNPSGVTAVNENNPFTVAIEGQLTSEMVLTDNGVDVTSQIGDVQGLKPDSKSTVLGQYTLISGGFNSGETWFSGRAGNGHDTSDTTTSNYYSSGSGSIAIFTYKLLFDDIPSTAIIKRLYVLVNAHAESTSQNSEYMCFQLRSGNTELSDELNFKTIGTSNSTQTIEATTLPTFSQLSNLVLYCRLGYYGGALNGATCYIEYNYTDTVTGYTISSVTEPHDIILSKVFIPEEEDPELVYHSLTISSINATTTPESGTTRIVEGTSQIITIYPTDPLLTLATNNGVDITNELVHYGQSIPDPTVSSVSGASYGFNLNSSTGYYVSQNAGQSTSAALCRVTFNLPVRCLITIQYINYAEATYDYGIFGNIDVSLGTTYNSSDNAYRTLSQSSDNSSSPQTLTYEIPSGEHYIDIKFRKDNYTDSNNDTLQWKILSIEPLEANEYYTYTISNIQDAHSLVFIFGDVTYYFITSTGTSCKLFPSGSMVQLPGDNYKLTIVPDNINDEVTITDNNSNVTDELQRIETDITKEGITSTIVNYIYNISNVQATHDIVVTCQSSSALYIKIAGAFTEVRKAFIKVSGTWRMADDPTTLFESNKIYIYNHN